ncbi:MAG: hypothetical protein K8R02_04040 [Anaerohalosphaeraceae bacterium]|nr:hypothetical protein [Anaerohalosphaeraceae bacterium]
MKSVSTVMLFVVLSFCPCVFADANTPVPDVNAIEIIADANTVIAELVCVLDTNDVPAGEVLQFRNRVIDFLRRKLPRPNKVTALDKNKIRLRLDLTSASGPIPACAGLAVVAGKVKPVRMADSKEVIVYVTKTGKRYHRKTCSSLSKSSIPLTLSEAKDRGYTPCKKCKP